MAQNEFRPRLAYISDITNAMQPTVTFTEEHDFSPGEIISFRVGKDFGMFQINNKRAKIILSSSDAVVVNIDTSTWGTFSLDNLDEPGTSPPICVPSSSSVVPFEENPSINIKDAFDNVRI